MPEKIIDTQQKLDVINWGTEQGGKTVKYFGPAQEERAMVVNGEPLIITFSELEYDPQYHRREPVDPDKHSLSCSDNHAQAMEATGVLSFSEQTAENSHE